MEKLEWPKHIIQHIQSFLDGGEAARTCLLSKSWYHAWSTRPILFFKFKEDRYRPDLFKQEDLDEFWNYVQKTINRYKQLNLKLEKLVLDEYHYHYGGGGGGADDDEDADDDHHDNGDEEEDDDDNDDGDEEEDDDIDDDDGNEEEDDNNDDVDDGGDEDSGYTIDKLITDASSMGITDLELRNRVSHDLLLNILAIKSLTKLSILDLRAEYLNDNDFECYLDGNVSCPSLVSLRLHGPYDGYSFSGRDSVIKQILLGCPLIESLDFKHSSLPNQHGGFSPELFAKLFAMRSFTKLSIGCCSFYFMDHIFTSSHLQSLRFNDISIRDDEFRDMLSACPLLENLDVRCCLFLQNIDVSKLVNLVAIRTNVSSCKVSFGCINDVPPEFHKLRSVWLAKAVVDSEFFSNFSSRFPRLKDLTLNYCTGFGSSIRISSHSLEHIQLRHDKELRKVEFDVPNIRKFVFDQTCDHIPSLSFHTTSMGWESKLRISCSLPVVKSCWFLKLREFLKEVSLSRISLNINVEEKQLIWVKDLPCLPTPVLECLKINNGTSTPVRNDLLFALLRCCRPTFIGISCLNSYGYSCAEILHELFLINQNNARVLSKILSLLTYDLEEIYLEMLDGKQQWQSAPLSKFVEDVDPIFECEKEDFKFDDDDDEEDPDFEYEKEEIRFRLKWGAFRCTS